MSLPNQVKIVFKVTTTKILEITALLGGRGIRVSICTDVRSAVWQMMVQSTPLWSTLVHRLFSILV